MYVVYILPNTFLIDAHAKLQSETLANAIHLMFLHCVMSLSYFVPNKENVKKLTYYLHVIEKYQVTLITLTQR